MQFFFSSFCIKNLNLFDDKNICFDRKKKLRKLTFRMLIRGFGNGWNEMFQFKIIHSRMQKTEEKTISFMKNFTPLFVLWQ